jgi:hypothetical protein
MDTMRMGKAQFEILGEELAKLEREQRDGLNKLFYPHGREAAYQRISAMCELSPENIGPISKEPVTWWKSRVY